MNNHKSLTIWTLVANFFIIIAAGHGIGTIGLLQLVTIADMLGLNDFFSSKPLFQHPLFWVVVASFLGQFLLLTSLLKKRLAFIRLAGVLLLLAAFFILMYYLRNQEALTATVVTGLPFLILSTLLTYKHVYKGEVVLEA